MIIDDVIEWTLHDTCGRQDIQDSDISAVIDVFNQISLRRALRCLILSK